MNSWIMSNNCPAGQILDLIQFFFLKKFRGLFEEQIVSFLFTFAYDVNQARKCAEMNC